MKKIVLTLIVTLSMVMGMSAQNVSKEVSNFDVPNYDRISKYLVLSHKQEKDLYPLMQQVLYSVKNSYKEADKTKAESIRTKAIADNKAAVEKTLDKEQQQKYFVLVQNTFKRYAEMYN